MPLMKLPEFPLYNQTKFSYLIKFLMHQSTIICFHLGMIILMVTVLLVITDLTAPYY